MPLHKRLRDKAGGSQRSIEASYKAATPFLRVVTDHIKKDGMFHLNIPEELNKGNPNVEKLMLYKEGYEQAMTKFLSLIDPT